MRRRRASRSTTTPSSRSSARAPAPRSRRSHEALSVDPSRLVALLDSLEQRGLIARQRDPQDRRRHVVSITAAGGLELRRLRGMVHALEDDFFAPLSAADRTVLHELLTALAARHDPSCCPLSEPD